jgi:hypothetical protein
VHVIVYRVFGSKLAAGIIKGLFESDAPTVKSAATKFYVNLIIIYY